MNKNQLFVMWIGVASFLLVLFFDPFYEIAEQICFLIAIPLIAGGLIITLKGKDKKTLPFFKWLEGVWERMNRPNSDHTFKHKNNEKDKKQDDDNNES